MITRSFCWAGLVTPITRKDVRPMRTSLPIAAGVAAEQLGDRARSEDHHLGLAALLALVEEGAEEQLKLPVTSE